MIESISQRGYKATTVAHAIALAGVSRRAFYELFPNKEECFLATYDIVVARSRKRVLDAWAGERGWANRVHAGAKALLDDVAEQPKGPRLVLVEALGVGPKSRERMQLAGFTFERMVVGAYQLAPDGVALSQLTARGIVGGVRQVVFKRLREGRERELLSLTDEVLDWIESYRTPAVARLGVPPSLVPRQAPTPAAFLARDDRRARVLGAVVHLTLDEGYSQLTDPQIAQFAGVSTEAFHKQFPSKEEAFLAAIDEFVAEALDSVRPALEEADEWSAGVYRVMVAFVQYVVEHEALLRIAFIDVFEVGPAIIGRLTRSVEELAKLLAGSAPEPRRGPSIAQEAIAGALWAIVASYVSNSRLKRLPCAVDQLTFTVLAPYLGPKDAIAAIGAARKPLRSV
jgi:AcrR family transcriptional regulator